MIQVKYNVTVYAYCGVVCALLRRYGGAAVRSNYDFDIMAIVICMILFVVITVQYRTSDTVRGYKKIAVLTALAAFLDIVLGRLDAVPSEYAMLLVALNTFYLMFPGTLGYAYVCYVGTFLPSDRMPVRQKFSLCALCAYYIALVVNLGTGFLFVVDSDGVYHDGPGRLFAYYFLLLFLLVVLITVLNNSEVFTKKQSYMLICFSAFLLIGMFMRMYVSDETPLTYICLALGLLTSIFFLETPDYNKLTVMMEELRTAKDAAEASEKKAEEAICSLETAKLESDAAKDDAVKAREEAERARRAAEKADKTKSEFLAGMSHEIRTPINAVLGFDEMILRESEEPMIKQYAMDIKSSGKTLLGIINDILDFSKVESGKMDIVPTEYRLYDLLRDVTGMFSIRARGKGLYFEHRIDPNIPDSLFGDDRRIKQILINILNNAVKYTDIGGSQLNVTYEKLSPEEILLKVSVSDTGRGMRAEDIEKLFKPYERIEEERSRGIEGTGLGMSITQRLLEMMDSKLKVESVFGEGSTFSFEIRQKVMSDTPIGNIDYRREAESVDRSVSGGHFIAPDIRILAVDDTEINLKVFKALLKHTKIRIDTATSGGEGFKRCCETKYDILFLDHMMPDVDGIETLELIRNYDASLNIDTPAVILTANALSGAREQYSSKGFEDYISKPVDPDTLESIIRKYISPEQILEEGTARYDEAVKALNERGRSTLKETFGKDAEETYETEGEAADSEKPQPEPVEDTFIKTMMSVPGISVSDGITATGGRELYEQVTSDYVSTASDVESDLNRFIEQEDWHNYTIKVHSLKSASRLIGATELADMAESLEKSGNAQDTDTVREKTPKLIAELKTIVGAIRPYFEDDSDKPPITEDKLREALVIIRNAATEFDLDTADIMMKQLSHYSIPENAQEMYGELKRLMAEVERDLIIELIDNYLK